MTTGLFGGSGLRVEPLFDDKSSNSPKMSFNSSGFELEPSPFHPRVRDRKVLSKRPPGEHTRQETPKQSFREARGYDVVHMKVICHELTSGKALFRGLKLISRESPRKKKWAFYMRFNPTIVPSPI